MRSPPKKTTCHRHHRPSQQHYIYCYNNVVLFFFQQMGRRYGRAQTSGAKKSRNQRCKAPLRCFLLLNYPPPTSATITLLTTVYKYIFSLFIFWQMGRRYGRGQMSGARKSRNQKWNLMKWDSN